MNRSRRSFGALMRFLSTESAGALVLAVGAALALIWANAPFSASYERIWSHHLLGLSGRTWVGDGLMTVFFLVVGLEIKREMTSGHLVGRRAAVLPVIAAIGGMAVPALLYLSIAGGSAPRGWAIPMATDIALGVGLLAVLGSRVPSSLRAFLLGLAIVDDIGAIVIIAVVYTKHFEATWLLGAVAALAVVVVARHCGTSTVTAYVVLGGVMWFCLHRSGVHPTLAGVTMGLLAPPGIIEGVERRLHPLASFVIVPLFALANVGITISTTTIRSAATSSITWGIIAGLVLGKPLGIVVASRLAIRGNLADSPSNAGRRQFVGIGSAAGIGFTVALFIAELAFPIGPQLAEAKLAILVASIVAASLSALLLAPRSSTER